MSLTRGVEHQVEAGDDPRLDPEGVFDRLRESMEENKAKAERIGGKGVGSDDQGRSRGEARAGARDYVTKRTRALQTLRRPPHATRGGSAFVQSDSIHKSSPNRAHSRPSPKTHAPSTYVAITRGKSAPEIIPKGSLSRTTKSATAPRHSVPSSPAVPLARADPAVYASSARRADSACAASHGRAASLAFASCLVTAARIVANGFASATMGQSVPNASGTPPPDERPKRVPAVSSALRSEPTGSRERVQKHVRRLHRRQRAHVREPLGFAFDRRRQVLRVLDAESNGAAVVVFRDGAVRGRGALGGARGGGDGGVAYGVRRYLQAGGVRGDHARFVLVDVADGFARVPRIVLVRFLEPRGSSAQRAVEERFTACDAEAGKRTVAVFTVFTVREESALRVIAHAFPVRERRVRATRRGNSPASSSDSRIVEIVPHAPAAPFRKLPAKASISPKSLTEVIPSDSKYRNARWYAAILRASLGSGIAAVIKPMAFSRIRPFGRVSFPRRDRSTRPADRRRSRPRVAAASAEWLASPACASARSTHTGRSGYFVSASASAIQEASGNEGGSQRLSSQPPPRSHVEASSPSASIRSAAARVAATKSAFPVHFERSSCVSLNPPETRCRCASCMPGMTCRPSKEITCAFAPAGGGARRRVPIAITLPASVTATASANGIVASPVHIVAFANTRARKRERFSISRDVWRGHTRVRVASTAVPQRTRRFH